MVGFRTSHTDAWREINFNGSVFLLEMGLCIPSTVDPRFYVLRLHHRPSGKVDAALDY